MYFLLGDSQSDHQPSDCKKKKADHLNLTFSKLKLLIEAVLISYLPLISHCVCVGGGLL